MNDTNIPLPIASDIDPILANPNQPFGLGDQRNDISYIQFSDYVGRMDPMKKEIWCTALQTEFAGKQGHRMLRTPEGNMCCLGVYCEVTGVPKRTEHREIDTEDGFKTGEITVYGNKYQSSWTFIPEGYTIPLTLDSERYLSDTFFYSGGSELFSAWTQNSEGGRARWQAHTLPNLNDEGLTFDQIADVIRYFL